MFAKVFDQIYNSSIAEDWQVRVVFEDFLVLADIDGVVDMTPEAISRRTNVPLDIVEHAIKVLESPDPKSRRTEDEGRRIRLLDEHREWGWFIINYQHYREIASEEQRREKTRERVRKYRKKASCNASETVSNDSPSTSSFTSAYASLFSLPTFSSEFEAYIEHRKAKKIKTTDHALELMLKRLAERPEQAIEALQECMIRGWTAFKWEWLDKDKQKGSRYGNNDAEKGRFTSV